MPKLRYITHSGKTLTISEWAKEVGLPIHVLKNRLAIGWSVSQALSVETRENRRYAEEYVTYNGTTKSLSAWAQERGIPERNILYRLAHGWTAAEALGFEARAIGRSAKKTITYEGVTKSLTEWASESGIHVMTLRQRIHRGWSVAEALGFEARDNASEGKRLITHDGETRSLTEWAKERGINVSTLRARLSKGWTVEEALGFKNRSTRKSKYDLTYKGRTLSVLDWANERAIRSGTIYLRLSKGWTVAQALGFEDCSVRRTAERQITYNGVTKSLSEWAGERNIPAQIIRDRLRLGWSVGQVLGFESRARAGSPRRHTKIFLTHKGVTRSIKEWSKETGIVEITLRWRKNAGWTDAQVLGFEALNDARPPKSSAAPPSKEDAIRAYRDRQADIMAKSEESLRAMLSGRKKSDD